MRLSARLCPVIVLAACAVASERPPDVPSWFYESLTPEINQVVPIEGRAARVLVHPAVPFAENYCNPDGECFHLDGYKPEIEVFFSQSVTSQSETTAAAWTAVQETCPAVTSTTERYATPVASLRYVRFDGICLSG